MMRRLSERELLREPARRASEPAQARRDACGEAGAVTRDSDRERAACLLVHVLRVLSPELDGDRLRALRPQLEHAIARGLRGDP